MKCNKKSQNLTTLSESNNTKLRNYKIKMDSAKNMTPNDPQILNFKYNWMPT